MHVGEREERLVAAVIFGTDRDGHIAEEGCHIRKQQEEQSFAFLYLKDSLSALVDTISKGMPAYHVGPDIPEHIFQRFLDALQDQC